MIKALEYLSSILLLTGIWYSGKHYNGWLVYLVASAIWTVVNIYYGLIGFTIVGFVTIVLAFKNYKRGKNGRCN